MDKKYEKPCEHCQKLFPPKKNAEGYLNMVNWSKQRFCSYECANSSRRYKNTNTPRETELKRLHIWIRRRKPQPECCEDCGVKNQFLDLANISQEYKHVIEDYEFLCRRCHMRKDGRSKLNLSQARQIRRLKEMSPHLPLNQIRKMFNVSFSTVDKIIKNIIWKDK